MKATVYFIEMTKAQIDELNALGWDSIIGKAYLAARDGKIDATNFDLLVKAASFKEAPNAEHVWVALQNFAAPWSTLKHITCHTAFDRSMDIGDIIVWEDGTRQRCVSIGFEPIEA